MTHNDDAPPARCRPGHRRGVWSPTRVRDGAGLVGPLVIPGVTSCLTYRQRERHSAPCDRLDPCG
jgi:hypothetical protein